MGQASAIGEIVAPNVVGLAQGADIDERASIRFNAAMFRTRHVTFGTLLLALFGAACGASSDLRALEDAGVADVGEKHDAGGDAPDAEPQSRCHETPRGRVELPRDDTFHSEPIEWWYWTGHLRTNDGRWFGFQQTFFLQTNRIGQAQVVHSALTDVSGETFRSREEYALTGPSRVDDGFRFAIAGQTAEGGNGLDRLHAEFDGATLDVALASTKAPVLQHGDGYVDYPFGGYTYYYSRARMTATGTVTVGADARPVSGTAWFDHQWGPLGDAVNLGWDWFALELDDDREIMLFIVRSNDSEPFVGGSLTDALCTTRELGPSEIEVASLGEWTSPRSHCTYPAGWTIRVAEVELRVLPALDDQEVNGAVMNYWEGAATIDGDATGRAYVELTGYCE